MKHSNTHKAGSSRAGSQSWPVNKVEACPSHGRLFEEHVRRIVLRNMFPPLPCVKSAGSPLESIPFRQTINVRAYQGVRVQFAKPKIYHKVTFGFDQTRLWSPVKIMGTTYKVVCWK